LDQQDLAAETTPGERAFVGKPLGSDLLRQPSTPEAEVDRGERIIQMDQIEVTVWSRRA
jgi:hypothetical protein